MDPLVSICMPSYNNAAYIGETIKAVLNQTYKNLELIIVDDCSRDNTVDIIQTFDDQRIKLFKNDSNLGMHGNWNKSLSLARGEYMKLLCGDDLITPDCIEKQVREFQKPGNDDVVMVACRRKIIKRDGSESFGAFYKLPPGKYKNTKAVKYCATFGTNLIGEPMAVLFRASVFKQNNIILGSNNYMIDMDMYFKLLAYGNLVIQKEFLASFRIYNESMSGTLGLKQAGYFYEFISQETLKKKFGINGLNKASGKVLSILLNIGRNLVFKLSNK